MKHPARIAALAVAVVVVVFGVVLALNVGDDPQTANQQSPFLGKEVPAFDLPTLAGDKVSNASTAGKTLIINFWNTWCLPCRDELPALKAFYAAHQNDPDLVMIGILRDPRESMTTIKSYVQDEGIKWTIARDPGDQAALDFGTRGQPETIAVSPNGFVTASKYSQMSVDDLEKFLKSARPSA